MRTPLIIAIGCLSFISAPFAWSASGDLTEEELLVVQRTVTGIAMAQGVDPDAASTVQLTPEEQQMALEIDRLAQQSSAAGTQGNSPQLTPAQAQMVERITQQSKNSGSMPTWLKELLKGVDQQGGAYSVRPINRLVTDSLQEALTSNIRNKTDENLRVEEQTRQVKAQMDASIGNAVTAQKIPTDGLPMPDPERRNTRSALIQQLEVGGGRNTAGGGALYGYLVYLNNWEVRTVRYNEELKLLNNRMGEQLDWNQRAELQNRLQLLRQQIDLHNAEADATAATTESALQDELNRERVKNIRLREETYRTKSLGTARPQY